MARPRNIKNQILSLREEGKTYNQISNELCCTKSTVNYHCKRHGLTDIGFKNNEIDVDTARDIHNYAQNNTIKKTSEKFGVSMTTVKKYKKATYVL